MWHAPYYLPLENTDLITMHEENIITGTSFSPSTLVYSVVNGVERYVIVLRTVRTKLTCTNNYFPVKFFSIF